MYSANTLLIAAVLLQGASASVFDNVVNDIKAAQGGNSSTAAVEPAATSFSQGDFTSSLATFTEPSSSAPVASQSPDLTSVWDFTPVASSEINTVVTASNSDVQPTVLPSVLTTTDLPQSASPAVPSVSTTIQTTQSPVVYSSTEQPAVPSVASSTESTAPASSPEVPTVVSSTVAPVSTPVSTPVVSSSTQAPAPVPAPGTSSSGVFSQPGVSSEQPIFASSTPVVASSPQPQSSSIAPVPVSSEEPIFSQTGAQTVLSSTAAPQPVASSTQSSAPVVASSTAVVPPPLPTTSAVVSIISQSTSLSEPVASSPPVVSQPATSVVESVALTPTSSAAATSYFVPPVGSTESGWVWTTLGVTDTPSSESPTTSTVPISQAGSSSVVAPVPTSSSEGWQWTTVSSSGVAVPTNPVVSSAQSFSAGSSSGQILTTATASVAPVPTISSQVVPGVSSQVVPGVSSQVPGVSSQVVPGVSSQVVPGVSSQVVPSVSSVATVSAVPVPTVSSEAVPGVSSGVVPSASLTVSGSSESTLLPFVPSSSLPPVSITISGVEPTVLPSDSTKSGASTETTSRADTDLPGLWSSEITVSGSNSATVVPPVTTDQTPITSRPRVTSGPVGTDAGTATGTPTTVPTTTAFANPSNFLPSNIITQDSPTSYSNGASNTGVNSATSTGSTVLPRVIAPSAVPSLRSDQVEVQIGFKYGLNYPFVVSHPLAAAQIFEYLPGGVSYGIRDTNQNDVVMKELAPYNKPNTDYLATIARIYIPKDALDTLSQQINTSDSRLYTNSDQTINTLVGLIDPDISVIESGDDSDSTDGADPTNPPNFGSQSNTAPGPAAVGALGSLDQSTQPGMKSRPSGTTAGIAVGTIGGALALGTLLLVGTRRFRKKIALDSDSFDDGSVVSPYHDDSDRSSYAHSFSGSSVSTILPSPAGQGPSISQPVMSENSLGWL